MPVKTLTWRHGSTPSRRRANPRILSILLCLALPAYADDAPRIERHGDLLCLSPEAVVALERDRLAWQRQLTEAQAVQVVPVLVAGALGVAMGVGVALLVTRRP